MAKQPDTMSAAELKNSINYSETLLEKRQAADLHQLREVEAKLAEYKKLERDLINMSLKSSHEVMVPLSEVGFFVKGRVKHPNEVLVFLGDNYFAERTAHECKAIIGRRT